MRTQPLSRVAPAALLAGLITLSACAPERSPPKAQTTIGAFEKSEAPAPSQSGIVTERVAPAPSAEKGAARSEQLAAKPAPDPAPPPVNDDPDQFLGQSGVAVAGLLGAPDLIRRDGSAEVWQYRGTAEGRSCALDVFLYGSDAVAPARTGTEGIAPGGLEVRYVDLRGAAASFPERRACLAAMLRAQQSRRG